MSLVLARNNSEWILPVVHSSGGIIPSFSIPHTALGLDGDCFWGGFGACNDMQYSFFFALNKINPNIRAEATTSYNLVVSFSVQFAFL